MRILTRYVLVELTKVFVVALVGLTLFMLTFGVVQEAVRQSLGLAQIALLLPYMLPEALRFAVPMTILFATCSVFGRLASGNEVVAIKALGIHPWAIVWPVLVMAFLLSLVSVWLNDVAVSWGRSGARRVVIQSVEAIAYSMLEQNRSYATRQFSINVQRVKGRKLVKPVIIFQGTDDEPTVTLVCEEAELRSDFVANTLTMVCYNGTIHWGTARLDFPDMLEREIPLDQASKKGEGRITPSDLALSAIPAARELQEKRNLELEQRLAARAGLGMLTGDLDLLANGELAADEARLARGRSDFYRLQSEPHRRWSNGFSCLCFIFVGIPVAIVRRNADFLANFFVCFAPILILYYPLMMLSVSQTKSGSPSVLVWSGNLVLAVVGWWCMRKVVRY